MESKPMNVKDLFIYLKKLLEDKILDGDEQIAVCHSEFLDLRFVFGADIAELSEDDDEPQTALMLEV